jgi:hypothetical protein
LLLRLLHLPFNYESFYTSSPHPSLSPFFNKNHFFLRKIG